MSHRVIPTLLVLAATVLLAPVPAAGQAQTSSNTWTPPRTAWGAPDLAGIWDFRTLTPLERPSVFEGKEFLADEEAAQFRQQAIEGRNADRRGVRKVTSNARTTTSGTTGETISPRTIERR